MQREPKRRPGRPATGVTPPLNVRVPQDVQDAARYRAARDGESLGTVVTRLLGDYVQQPAPVTITDLAVAVGMSRAPEKVARWAGCLTPVDPRTGRIPEPWHGKGMDATFTRREADQLIAQWNRDSTDAERVEYLSSEGLEIADRYRP